MMGLTPRQAEVLATVKKLSRDGVSPTIRDIAAAMGTRSVSSIHHAMVKLAERGHLKHLPRRSRSFAVVEMGAAGDAEGLLMQLARRRRMTRDQLVEQAITEFLDRELRA